jgi:phosphatidylserine/phosphatidylglycerophosphate/cardiolipin synthase-like enzyme
MKIQPILTPDNYIACVLPLIQSAKKSFYMQTQYIHPSDKPGDKPLADLINAVIELQKKKVDVKLILSEWEVNGTGGFLEKLQAAGLDLSAVKIQNGVHNKGVVVDSSVVMLGSQNWSADGVIRNRDASLIIYNAEAAQYYEQIFLHDWANMAQPAAAKG